MRTSRRFDELRPLTMTPGVVKNADGSVLVKLGDTHVICTAKLVDGVPGWRRGTGAGWLTAEYGMLPAATSDRMPREASRGKQGGRTHEIQRLIGRSLRAVVDLVAMRERTLYVDCDVIQADGGTRTAAISGAYVAVVLALRQLGELEHWKELPLFEDLAAVSVGVVDGQPVLDLDYEEDSGASLDMNVVLTGNGRLVEVQATAEGPPFARETLDALLDLAAAGSRQIAAVQQELLGPGMSAGGGHLLHFVLATGNRHKLGEFAGILAPHHVEIMPAGIELPPEGTESFVANARAKALALAAALREPSVGPVDAHAAIGPWCIADDSGLEVEALGGAPGVTSSRYAGVEGDDAANNAKLLRELGERPQAARRARFVCVIVAVAPDGAEIDVRGEWPGVIAARPAGSGGFGYDPLFVPDGSEVTVAELADDEKNRQSHRARAGQALLARLAESGGAP